MTGIQKSVAVLICMIMYLIFFFSFISFDIQKHVDRDNQYFKSSIEVNRLVKDYLEKHGKELEYEIKKVVRYETLFGEKPNIIIGYKGEEIKIELKEERGNLYLKGE